MWLGVTEVYISINFSLRTWYRPVGSEGMHSMHLSFPAWTTWKYLVKEGEMPYLANWASAWANHPRIRPIQSSGNLMTTASQEASTRA